MNFNIRTLAVMCSVSFSLSVNSQVTIGSDEKPAAGALLQLKNIDGVEGSGPNSTKGLGLPRIEILPNGKIKGSESLTLDNELMGMIGYNIVETDEYCIGLHVWDGSQWIDLTNKQAINETNNYDSSTGILQDVEGNQYTTARFGDAGIWMTQNLRTEKYYKCGELRDFAINGLGGAVDSDSERQIGYPNVFGASISTKAYFNNRPELGVLYNWCAATNRVNATADEENDLTGVQGICPDGWHVSSTQEVIRLVEEVNQNTSKYSTLSDIKSTDLGKENTGLGRAMLSSNQPKIGTKAHHGVSNSNDNNGFNMYALGYGLSGIVNSAGGEATIYANIWAASNSNSVSAYYFYSVLNDGGEYIRLKNVWNKRALFPVRCKKN